MKKFLFLGLGAVIVTLLLTGCFGSSKLVSGDGRMVSEDIEVPKVYPELINVLHDPAIRPNSREKYEAARKLIKVVDMTFTRETKTLNALLCHRDAIIDDPRSLNRTIIFNYQYGDDYIRFIFKTYREWIVRVDVIDSRTVPERTPNNPVLKKSLPISGAKEKPDSGKKVTR